MSDRWEDNVHYKDFSPESARQRDDRDAVVLAEAWLYSKDERYALGIIVLVSGIELFTGRVTLEAALEKGRALRDRLVVECQSEASELRSNRVYLYSWTGQRVD